MKNIYIMQTGKLYMDGLAFENWPNVRQQVWAFKAYMLMTKNMGFIHTAEYYLVIERNKVLMWEYQGGSTKHQFE